MKWNIISRYLILFIGLSYLSFLSGCGEDKNNPKIGAGNEGVTVSDPTQEVDDGSWVYIIDNKKITKEEFEQTYHLWVNIAASASGVNQEQASMVSNRSDTKKAMIDRLISIQLASSKTLQDSYFKTEEGKKLDQAFAKQALNQYFLYKTVLSKIKEPKNSDVEAFYKKNQAGFTKRGLKKLETKEEYRLIKSVYRKNIVQRKIAEQLEKIKLAKIIMSNEKALVQYISGTITKKEIEADEQNYWLLKIKNHPDDTPKILHLKDTINLIDNQIKMLKSRGGLKNKTYIKQYATMLLNNLTMMELGYQSALQKGYHKQPEGIKFVNLVRKRLLANYYLYNNILAKVKPPNDTEIKEILSDKQKMTAIKNILKNQRIKPSDANLKSFLKAQLFREKQRAAQRNFVDELKKSHSVILSEKYLETESDKLQNKILESDKQK